MNSAELPHVRPGLRRHVPLPDGVRPYRHHVFPRDRQYRVRAYIDGAWRGATLLMWSRPTADAPVEVQLAWQDGRSTFIDGFVYDRRFLHPDPHDPWHGPPPRGRDP